MRESQIEKYLVRRVEALGGTCEKFVSPNRRSVPDRLVTLPDGRMFFVEVKAPGKRPTAAQARDHERRRTLGVQVYVVHSCEGVDSMLAEFLV